MALPKVSPLHKVIDAGRWDAEPPLGRLVIVVHAAFLDAGFVPHGAKVPKSGRLPKQVGRTASTLSLRYTAPQLLHRRDAEPAVLRLRAVGRHIVFYVCIRFVDPRPDPYFVSLDALAAALLLSRGLDDTGRALRNDALVAALWKALTDGMCRRLLVKVCLMYGVPLEPTIMSLPDEVKVAIVGRLTDGTDLARVERTCPELRRLVADHDDVLWKPRFEALTPSASSFFLPDDDDDDNDGAGAGETEVRSWKARYMRAKRRAISWRDRFPSSWINLLAPLSDWLLPSPGETADAIPGHGRFFYYSLSRLFDPDHYVTTTPMLIMPLSDWLLPSHGQTADAVPGRMRIREKKRGTSMPGHGRSRTAKSDGYRKKQHGAGAIHSPSSRYRWKHR